MITFPRNDFSCTTEKLHAYMCLIPSYHIATLSVSPEGLVGIKGSSAIDSYTCCNIADSDIV